MLTKAMKEKYLKGGGVHCPYCESENVSPGFFDKEKMTELVICGDCGREWLDKFQIADIEEVKWQEVNIELKPEV